MSKEGDRFRTYRYSLWVAVRRSHTRAHTHTQLNGGSLIKQAIPPPASATVLTFEKSRHITSQRRQRSRDFILTP